jgi:hypothetical protein
MGASFSTNVRHEKARAHGALLRITHIDDSAQVYAVTGVVLAPQSA